MRMFIATLLAFVSLFWVVLGTVYANAKEYETAYAAMILAYIFCIVANWVRDRSK